MDTMKNNPSLIEKKYVLSFTVRFSATALFLFLVFDFVLWLALNRHLGQGYLRDIAILNHLQEHLPIILLISCGIQAVAASLVILTISLFWAHAIAGPVLRLRKYLRMIIENRPFTEEMIFRRDDQLHNLAETFGRMQNKRKERRNLLAIYCAKADDLLAAFEKTQDKDTANQKETKESLIKIYEKMKEVFVQKGNC